MTHTPPTILELADRWQAVCPGGTLHYRRRGNRRPLWEARGPHGRVWASAFTLPQAVAHAVAFVRLCAIAQDGRPVMDTVTPLPRIRRAPAASRWLDNLP